MTIDPWRSGNQSERKSGRGCLFYGCLTLIIIVILTIIVVFFAVRAFVHRVTENKPIEFAPIEVSTEDTEKALTKFQAFENAWKSGQGVKDSYTLTEQEFNALLLTNKDLAQFKDAVRVSFKGNAIIVDFSHELGGMVFDGRYMNAQLSAVPSVTRGNLKIVVTELKVAGHSLTEGLQGAKNDADIGPMILEKYPNLRPLISKIESAELKGSVLHIELRQATPEALQNQ